MFDQIQSGKPLTGSETTSSRNYLEFCFAMLLTLAASQRRTDLRAAKWFISQRGERQRMNQRSQKAETSDGPRAWTRERLLPLTTAFLLNRNWR